MPVSTENRYPVKTNPAVIAAATRISISIIRSADGTSKIRFVEIASGSSVKRTNYRDADEQGSVLNAALADELGGLIARFSKSEEPVAKPEYKFSLPGLVLGRLRLTRLQTDGNPINTVRFGECIGNTAAIFGEGGECGNCLPNQLDVIAAETLENVFLPLMDLSRQIGIDRPKSEQSKDFYLRDRLENAKNRIDAMEFYYNMLSEYVAKTSTSPKRRTVEALVNISRTA